MSDSGQQPEQLEEDYIRRVAEAIYLEVAEEPLGDLSQRRMAVQTRWHDAVRTALTEAGDHSDAISALRQRWDYFVGRNSQNFANPPSLAMMTREDFVSLSLGTFAYDTNIHEHVIVWYERGTAPNLKLIPTVAAARLPIKIAVS